MNNMPHKILINVEDDETRIALMHGSSLDNLYIEQTQRAQKVGNIYCGTVVKIQPSFQAAFIDYGEERHGFLALSDINFQVYKPQREMRGRPSISQVLKPGQKILVQVIKDEIAHKGASLTTNISLPGRFLVFMPDSDRGGVSRKIEDEEQRTRLRHLLKGLGGEDASAIIRKVGVDRTLTELKRDFMILRRTWNEIEGEFEAQSAPGLLYQEENAPVRMIRDYYHEKIAEVVIDEPLAFQRALEFFQAHMPTEQKKLQLYLGEKSLFAAHEIEGQIEVLHHPQVPLPSGGSLVIMPTEALVAIDVNSGRSTQEKNIEDTALRTNLEAAEEVARQLRLRNLGGLVVVDFIDMDNAKNRVTVAQQLEESMAADKAKTSFSEISKFGLLEMSRQRISGSLSRNSITLTLANRILRKMQDSAIDQKVLQIHIRLPVELATHLLNAKRQKLTQLEMDYGIRISITPDTQLGAEEVPEMEVTLKTQGGGETRTTVPISAAEMRDDKAKRKYSRRKKTEETKTAEEVTTAKKTTPTEAVSPEKEPERPVREEKQTPEKTLPLSQKTEPERPVRPEVPTSEKPERPLREEKIATEKPERPSQSVAEEKTKSGTLFSSIHEPVEIAETDARKRPEKQLPEPEPQLRAVQNEKTKSVSTMFRSVHLEEESEAESPLPEHPEQSKTYADFAPPMFSSTHLKDEDESEKNTEVKPAASPKKPRKSPGRPKKTTPRTGSSDSKNKASLTASVPETPKEAPKPKKIAAKSKVSKTKPKPKTKTAEDKPKKAPKTKAAPKKTPKTKAAPKKTAKKTAPAKPTKPRGRKKQDSPERPARADEKTDD